MAWVGMGKLPSERLRFDRVRTMDEGEQLQVSSSTGVRGFLKGATILNTSRGKVHLLYVLVQNIRSAVLVAMISMVLSIGLGIASGAAPIAALRAAIWAGLLAGLVGSSPFNVMGPAGALSNMLSSYSAQWTPDILPWISLISAAFSCLALVFKLQKYCLLMPKSVFEGFTISVGLTIGLKQLNYAFGLTGLPKHESILSNIGESLGHLDHARWESMVLFFPQAILLYLLMRLVPKVPWLIIIPLSTIILGFVFRDPSLGWALPTLKTAFGELPNTVAVLPSTRALTQCNDVLGLVVAGASVAFVSVLETLISAKLADLHAADNQRGPFSEGQEVAAMSAAQALSGFCGGLPVTGVFVRTSANQNAGASHPLSQFMNAIIVLIITLVAMPVFSYMPLPTVAALLVVSSIRMMPFRFLRSLWTTSKKQFFLSLLTAAICFAYEPTVGLLAGTLIAYLMEAMSFSSCHEAVRVTGLSLPSVDLRVVRLTGPLVFANVDAVVRRGTAEPEPAEVADGAVDGAEQDWGKALSMLPPVLKGAPRPAFAVIDVEGVTVADTDGAEAAARLAELLACRVGEDSIFFVGPSAAVQQALSASAWFRRAAAAGRVVPKVQDAVSIFHQTRAGKAEA